MKVQRRLARSIGAKIRRRMGLRIVLISKMFPSMMDHRWYLRGKNVCRHPAMPLATRGSNGHRKNIPGAIDDAYLPR